VTTPQPAPIVWRTPQIVAAALFLITAALVAVALYVHLGTAVRLGLGALALGFGAAGAFAARQVLVADDEGVFVRRLLRSESPDWSEVDRIIVVRTGKTGMTIALNLTTGRQLLVPPSLVLPTTPHGLTSTHALLESKARQLGQLGRIED
jgi:hypothetical protein